MLYFKTAFKANGDWSNKNRKEELNKSLKLNFGYKEDYSFD